MNFGVMTGKRMIEKLLTAETLRTQRKAEARSEKKNGLTLPGLGNTEDKKPQRTQSFKNYL